VIASASLIMTYYPIFLDIEDRPCAVVGGGEVARRKVEGLVACGARVRVVARDLTERLLALRDGGVIEHVPEDYSFAAVTGSFLVFGATDDEDVNGRIAADCRRAGILVNIADDPERCDFILPSVCRRGDLTIAVSTGGKSPALAKRIREELEDRYGEEYADLLEILGSLRGPVIARGLSADENREVFTGLLEGGILEAVRRRDWDEVRRLIREGTGEEPTLPCRS